MSTPLRLAAFLAGLAVVFAAAVGLGKVVDPLTDPEAEPTSHDGSHGGDHEQAASPETAAVSLRLDERQFAPGNNQVSFQLRDEAGEPVTSYDVKHEKRLHLIVLATRSQIDYQHVHPALASDGTWTADLRLAPGTSYRLYADGSTAGNDFLATADLFTTGHTPSPAPVPAPADTAVVDGYDVTLTRETGTATLEVRRNRHDVDLEPYLGALGHLVVIRVDDLSYLHVHPEEGAPPTFAIEDLAPGRYRFFFDFKHNDVVRTASFTVSTEDAAPHATEGESEEDSHDDH